MEKRGKLEKDAQIMIKMLTRQIETERKMNRSEVSANKAQAPRNLEKLNRAVFIDYTEHEGRSAKASRAIKSGEEILCEKAHCASLFETYAKSHCQNCFQR